MVGDIMAFLFSDWRLQFLAGFAAVTLILAGILTLTEQRIRRNRRLAAIRNAQNSFVTTITEKLRSELSLREKLDFIDEIAKEYFAEMFGTAVHSDYSYLQEEFKRRGEEDIVRFCEAMFSAYYLKRSPGEKDVEKIFTLFISAYNKRRGFHNTSRIPPVQREVPEHQREQEQNKAVTPSNVPMETKTAEPAPPVAKVASTAAQAKESIEETPIEKKEKKLPALEKPRKQNRIRKALSHARKKLSRKKKTKKTATKKKVLIHRRNSETLQQEQKELKPIFLEQTKPRLEQKEERATQTTTSKENEEERERSIWLKDLKKRKLQKENSAGTNSWLTEIRKALHVT